MIVELISPANVDTAEQMIINCARAASVCVDGEDKEKTLVDSQKLILKLIEMNHTSVIEHISYMFLFRDITRALLQEVSRHRIASPTVKSTRWALKKTDNKTNNYYIPEEFSGSDRDEFIRLNEEIIKFRRDLKDKYSNDILKYAVMENMYTSIFLTINARSLINMFDLRSSPRALQEFQTLCGKIKEVIPTSHRFMYCIG